MRRVPWKTLPTPHRTTALNRSATMGNARNSRAIAATLELGTRPAAHAGAPDDRRGSRSSTAGRR